jgi:hypothetical protein
LSAILFFLLIFQIHRVDKPKITDSQPDQGVDLVELSSYYGSRDYTVWDGALQTNPYSYYKGICWSFALQPHAVLRVMQDASHLSGSSLTNIYLSARFEVRALNLPQVVNPAEGLMVG